MRIALGADHAGVGLKAHVRRLLDRRSLAFEDLGPETDDSVDYPDYALGVARRVASGACRRGILICGSGVGMAIAANKVRGIRAAAVATAPAARLARRHNDVNVLALGARSLSVDDALDVVDAFLTTPFDGGRHQRRVDKIAAAEQDRLAPAEETAAVRGRTSAGAPVPESVR